MSRGAADPAVPPSPLRFADLDREDVLAFIREFGAHEDDVLRKVAEDVRLQGLPRITPEAGRMLELLVRLVGARRVLEVGTCLGYSAIWMARGLPPGGTLETLELDPARAERARQWFQKADVSDRVRVLVEDAHELLPRLANGRYDLVFLDADKEWMPQYLEESLRLLRPGGILAADNVFWHGSTLHAGDPRPGAREMRAFVQGAAADKRLVNTILPLGDGLLVAQRLPD